MILGREEEFAELAKALANASPGARERAEVLARASKAISAACACHVLAEYHEKRGFFSEALRSANSALTRLASARAKGSEVDKLRAMLVVMRGLAYAGLGEVDHALSVHDELQKTYPSFPGLRVGAFRICIRAAARVGELEDALQIVDTRADGMRLPEYDAVLCEALRAVVGQGTPDQREVERARLVAELELDGLLASWLRAAAPALAQALIMGPNAPDSSAPLIELRGSLEL